MQKNIIKFNYGFATAIGLLGFFLLSSCSKDVSLGNPGNANRTSTEQAAAFQFTENVSVPFDFIAFIDCANGGAGEEVQFSGTLHSLFHITDNGNGFTVKTHNQPQGLKGIGVITGDTYNATGVTQDTQNGKFINGSFTYTWVNNFKLIGPGTGNNYLIHENYTITINANGTVVMERDNYSFECK